MPKQARNKSQVFHIFPWSPSFATGIDLIDTQHQQLVSILNRLARHFVSGATSDHEVEAIISELTDYADYHFQCEEQVWQKHFLNHPLLAAHEQAHQDFFDMIASLTGKKGNLEEFANDLFSFLTRWLALHILDSDKRMALATLRMDDGEPMDQALIATEREISGARAELIRTILSMYGELSSNTMELMRQKLARQRAEEALHDKTFREAEKSLRLSEARYSILFDAIPDGVLIVEVHSARVLGFNRVMETLVGRSHEQLAQMKVYDLHPEKDRDFHISHFASLSAKALSSITNARFEARMLRSDGQEIDVEISGRGPFRYGKAQCMVGIVRDISESKKYQQSLEYVAYHDELTGLFNRNGIKRYLTNRREQGQFNDLLVHADIDNFTRINEQYDIEFGNKVLTAFAKQLEGVLPQGSQIARLGGDEFILVVGADLAEGSLAGLILRLMNTLQLPVSVNADTVSLSVSAGIKHFSEEDQANEEVLLRQVAHALYLAKIKGTAQFHLLDQLQEDSERSRNELLNRIEHGLQEQEFELFYQPQIDLHSGNVIGAEALIRWRHPEEGLLSPFHFIPATVNHRVSRLIDNWVLQQSLQQIAQWQQYWPHLKISCNISAMSLQDTTFSDRLDAMLQEYPQVLPSNLGVELLESSAMEDRQATIANLQQLKCRGVCSSIDDFGTGYSSLSYLMQLPIDWLKLDKSFIADMSGEMQNNALIDGVITIGKAFDLSIIAEGIETLEQGTMLINMGCQYGQGYAIARPMPASEFTDWLNQWEPPAVWLEAASHPSK